MSTYAYMRVSTKTQADKNGCQTQQYMIEEYCEQNGIVIDKWYEDDAISGTIVDRPALNEMLGSLKKNDTVIVSGISRLWRDNVSALVIKKILRDKEVNVIDIEHPWYSIYDDPDDKLGNFLNTYVELQNISGRKKLIKKFTESRRNRAKKGYKPCGLLPYGYKWRKNEVVIDIDKQDIVKDIFENYVKLRSLSKLKDYCDKAGYRTSRGGEFSKQALKIIIENDFYIGIVTYNGEKVTGEHPVFLDTELFRQANEILKR